LVEGDVKKNPQAQTLHERFIERYAQTRGSLRAYFKAVEDISTAWRKRSPDYPPALWFRGHSNIRFELVPSRYRPPFATMNWDREHEMMIEFRRKAGALVPRPHESWWDWAFLARHHGLPSRLLDWTEYALFGLFFAVAEGNTKEPACVWILDPYWLNGEVGQIGHVVVVPFREDDAEPVSRAYLRPFIDGRTPDPEMPIAMRPPHVSPRIVAQNGTFTMFGNNHRSLLMHGFQANEAAEKTFGKWSGPLQLLRIPRANVDGIRRELVRAGVTKFSAFPDLDGLAWDIGQAQRDRES